MPPLGAGSNASVASAGLRQASAASEAVFHKTGAGGVFQGHRFAAERVQPQEDACGLRPEASIAPAMQYALMILAVLSCLAAQGCAPATDRLPPDSVMNPRGT
jgi:hypothetical protein